MKTCPPRHHSQRSVRTTVAILGCAALVTVSACSGSSSGGAAKSTASDAKSTSAPPASTGSSASSTSTGSSGSTGVAAEVAQLEKPVTSYTLPSTPINTKSLSGKTIYYIPITQQASSFKVVGDAVTAALAKVGMKTQICDGAANPTSISACVNQAVGAGAAGIIMDAIPYVLAANALSRAQAKGVPVVVTDQLADPSHPAGAKLGYVPGPGPQMLAASAKWIIADSGGKAVVVANQVSDNPSSIAFMASALSVFKTECPGCKVVVNKVAQSNFQLVAPSTSSAVLKTPGVNYVLAEYDNFLQPTAAGVQQAGKAASVKLVSTAAVLSSLQAMAKGKAPAADVGQDLAFQGWSDVDAILRLALKKPVPKYSDPYRLLTRNNIHSIVLTQAAFESGKWFGPADFATKFAALWKAS